MRKRTILGFASSAAFIGAIISWRLISASYTGEPVAHRAVDNSTKREQTDKSQEASSGLLHSTVENGRGSGRLHGVDNIGGAIDHGRSQNAYTIPRDTAIFEQILREEGIGTTPDELIAYLCKLSGSDSDLLQLDNLFVQLGDPKFENREIASAKCCKLGPVALPTLRHATNEPDLEARTRAIDCITAIRNQGAATECSRAAVCTLVFRGKSQAVSALVRFLPYCADATLEEELYFGIDELVREDEQQLDTLRQFLDDRLSARRALAGCLLARLGNDDDRVKVRQLLKDNDPWVQLRCAQGLLGAGVREAVPSLISLLDGTPLTLAWQAEELLDYVAGDTRPESRVGTDSQRTGRSSTVLDWTKWWNVESGNVDVDARMKANQSPRLVLVAIENLSARAPTSTLELIGGDGQSHWQVRIPERKVHDIAIAGDRFALSEEVHDFADAEQRDHLTVRDFNGGLKWEYPCCPRSCGWLEAGLLWTWQPNNFCLWDIEALDKPIRRIKIQRQGSTSSRLFVLPNQHLALPQDAPVGEAGLRWKDLGRYDKDLGADCNVARETSRHTDVCLQFVRGQLLLFPPSQKPSFINIANGVATGVLPMEPNARLDRDGTQFLYSDQPHPRAIALTPDGKGLWEFYCPTQCQVVKSCLGIVQLGFGKCRPGFTRPAKGGK